MDILEKPDGRIVVAGSNHHIDGLGPVQFGYLLVMQINTNGQKEWCFKTGGPDWAGPNYYPPAWNNYYGGACLNPDGSITIAGWHRYQMYSVQTPLTNFIMKISHNGDSLWTKEVCVANDGTGANIYLPYVRFSDIIRDLDGNYKILAGKVVIPNQKYQWFIFHVDSMGQILDSTEVKIPPNIQNLGFSFGYDASYFNKKDVSETLISTTIFRPSQISISDKTHSALFKYNDSTKDIPWFLDFEVQRIYFSLNYLLWDSTILHYNAFCDDQFGQADCSESFPVLNRYNYQGGLLNTIYPELIQNNPFGVVVNGSRSRMGVVTQDSCILTFGTAEAEFVGQIPNGKPYCYVRKICRDFYAGQELNFAKETYYISENSIYPNPGTGQYHISHGQPLARLRVWDSRGALALDVRPLEGRFSLEGRPAGLYLWEATDPEGRVHRGRLVQQAAQ
ncbi:MAG: hypothetical protein N2050_10605 [Flavobacteriales bacterium]|nr:hypothetical protein [Flavobacteriales bacterium]